jgi:uncharacterized RDD family membrane protein YckC
MKLEKILRNCLATALGLMLVAPSTMRAADSDETNAPAKAGNHRSAVVSIGKDVEVKAGETAQDVVVIGGSAKVLGDVDEDVVIVGGDAEVDGDVGGNVVTVMGDARLGPKAVVHHDLVAVGGGTTSADGAVVKGESQQISMGAAGSKMPKLQFLRTWFRDCLMELRPLAPGVGWIWWIPAIFSLLYWLVAVLFPHPVQCCVNQISERPATTLAAGILTKLALPIIFVVLCVTVIGILVLPFVFVAELVALVVGKVAILQYLGGKIGGPLGLKPSQTPVLAFFIGAVVITLLYMVPVVGMLTFVGLSVWGVGVAVTAAAVALRHQPPPAGSVPLATFPASAGSPPPGFVTPGVGETTTAPTATSLTPQPALAYPRAGFWERMAAGFLDMAIIGLCIGLTGPIGVFVGVAYFTGMWAWKGTTVGGIVLNLHVVREDGRPLSFMAAFVRCVAALFSAAILFLGFFWIGWDREKQSWHDKIAGTVVVRLPRAIPLVLL